MIRFIKKFTRRFARDEDANATVEFVILFPAFVWILMSAVEMGMSTMRLTMLERGVDMAVRDVRLGTGTMQSDQLGHDALRTAICEYSMYIPDCLSKVKLEMISVDLRGSVNFPGTADCVDSAAPSNPVRTFTAGQANELMLLQVCAKFEPLFPTSIMGKAWIKDSSGLASMYAFSAFVQEPQ